MKNPFRERGFKSYREESKRREELAEQRKGKLWRMFLKDNEEDVPVTFLHDEPVLFYEHSILMNGKWINITCEGEDCEYCADGKRPSYKGAFLVVDHREFEVDERDKDGNKTGKKTTVRDRIKIFVRGTKDLGKLDRMNTKYGLTNMPYFVTKVGTGQASSYEFDRGDKNPLTEKRLNKYLSTLPDRYKGMDVYEILEDNIFGSENDDDTPKKTARRNVEIDDDEIIEVDEKPKKSPLQKKKPLSKKENKEPASSVKRLNVRKS